jgi:hypothetical protein
MGRKKRFRGIFCSSIRTRTIVNVPALPLPCNLGDFKFTQLVIGDSDHGIVLRQAFRSGIAELSFPGLATACLIDPAACRLIAPSKSLSCYQAQCTEPFPHLSQLPICKTATGHLCSGPQPIS